MVYLVGAGAGGRFKSGGTVSAPHRSTISANRRADTKCMRISSLIFFGGD